MSGLKPDHFYNVRIIAVGSNNFQAGSRVLRLRTFGEDGRPRLGTARLPSSFSQDDVPARQGEAGDENGSASKPLVTTFGNATTQDASSAAARDGTSSSTGTPSAPRRNTVGRKHSPSTTSLDKQPVQDEPGDTSTAQLGELNQRFLSLRKDTEETVALITKEDEDTKRLLDELETEKQEKRREQKKKEEQTEKLKREQGSTDRAMRNALQKKAQKEKALREKRAELAKLHDSMTKWDKGIEDMRKEQDSYGKQKGELERERDVKAQGMREANADLQRDCSRLEAELKERRQQVKELEDARKELPGNEEDVEWREGLVDFRKEWQRKELHYRTELLNANRKQQALDNNIHILSAQLQHIPQSSFGLYNQANSSGYDFDNSPHSQVKRRSRNSNSLSNVVIPSPSQGYAMADASSAYPPTRTSLPPGFVTGPFMGLSADEPDVMDMDDVGFRALTAGAPLSPSATSLLPSNIFADDEPPSPSSHALRVSPFAAPPIADKDPQSPASSGRSMSILSSPHGSTQNLPFPQFSNEAGERRSMKGTLPSPIAPPGQPAGNKLGNLFSFQRSRGAKPLEEDGPALGSLKQGQSQSFPRQTDDEAANKGRRISLSAWNMFNRNSAGPELMEGHMPPPHKSGGFSARNLFPFASRAGGGILDRDPSSPRPASIASSDMPRPSTDSASIWGPPAEHGKPSRLWSPDNAWSRNPSRRPSVHGSPSALKTNLASADDEILDEAALQNPQVSPSQVGVIGSRPPAARKSLTKSLNPAAPTFMTNLFRPKPDKDKEGGKEREKSRGKDKDKSRDKAREKSKGRDATPEAAAAPSIAIDESPSESRISRDGLSVHTQTSVSESRESLSLDHSLSNTPSEPNSGAVAGVKDPDSAFRKLFRKDSTSKLSLSQRIRRTKGGPGSVTNSEKNMSTERSSIGDFEDIGDESSVGRGFDSVTSSPSLGPAKSRDRPESRLKSSGSWFSIKKKTKEKESLELDRDRVSESETPGEDDRRLGS